MKPNALEPPRLTVVIELSSTTPFVRLLLALKKAVIGLGGTISAITLGDPTPQHHPDGLKEQLLSLRAALRELSDDNKPKIDKLIERIIERIDEESQP